ncbi:D-xylose-proton symporter-like 3, chloroplastic [Linum grandiflorum]
MANGALLSSSSSFQLPIPTKSLTRSSLFLSNSINNNANRQTPFSITCLHSKQNSNLPFSLQRKSSLFASRCHKMHRLNVECSAAGEDADSLVSRETSDDDSFSWSSVILPFVFPALGGLLFGYDIGATSGATISIQSPDLSGTTWFSLSAVQLGLVVSGSLYGALLGSILVYPTADFLGRRRELIIAAGLYLLGGITTAYAPGLGVLLAGRLLYGLGIGMAMHGAPLYIAETCPSQIRGTLISLKELFIVLGILVRFFSIFTAIVVLDLLSCSVCNLIRH